MTPLEYLNKATRALDSAKLLDDGNKVKWSISQAQSFIAEIANKLDSDV